jgi:hypothetical protein
LRRSDAKVGEEAIILTIQSKLIFFIELKIMTQLPILQSFH